MIRWFKENGESRSAPLQVQVVLLLLATLAAAQVINVLAVMTAPPPEFPYPAQVPKVAQALACSSVEDDETPFRTTTSKMPPYDDFEDAEEREFRDAVSRRLKVASSEVRIVMRAGLLRSGSRDGSSPEIGGPGTPPLFFRIGSPGGERPVFNFLAALHRADGLWCVASLRKGFIDPWQQRALLWLLGSLLLAGPSGYFFTKRITAPIRSFAEAAERLGRDPRAPALAAEGPAEIGSAARAFNEMQRQLRRYVDDQTAMIGAIAHDLRTPLTRLAFHLEAAPDDLRARAVADIAEMEAMIAAALAFTRDATRAAVRERIELSSLVESIVADMAETGSDVCLERGEQLVIEADPLGLRRVVANLVVNACRYGQRARLRVRHQNGWGIIEVDDDGPGLPQHELEQVFEPFYRAERSRNRRTGGVGLGLPAVRAIVLAHGGKVSLRNRPGGGLRATVSLPVSGAT